MPKRIQRKRTRGWKMPAGAIYVGRGSLWGNRYRIGDNLLRANGETLPITREEAVKFFELEIETWRQAPEEFEKWIAPLRGHDLACWCKEGETCHADVLLRIANEE